MSYTKQLFMAAVAACALIAFLSPARAQEAKKEAALEGQDIKFFREMAQSDLAE